MIKGEYVMNFTSSSVAWGALGDPNSVVADVAIVAPMLLRLTVTAPSSMLGDVIYASYTNPGYPTGPETSAMSIAIQADGTKQVWWCAVCLCVVVMDRKREFVCVCV
jgi:hypothetical protein